MTIRYTEDLTAVREDMLTGFFADWPHPPSPRQHLAVLRGSHRAVLATYGDGGRVVGFVHMLSDGVLTAFIPWLEVLPAHRGRGIGSELMRRVLRGTEHLYSVDLLCDPPLQPYYARFGLTPAHAAALRRPSALDGPGS